MSESRRERREQERGARKDFDAVAKEAALLAANCADPKLREVILDALVVLRDEDRPSNLISAQMLLAAMAAAARNDVPSAGLLILMAGVIIEPLFVEYNLSVLRKARQDMATALAAAEIAVPIALPEGTASPPQAGALPVGANYLAFWLESCK